MFYADWCPFCRKFKAIFETSANSLSNSQQKFFESNIDDDNNPLWERFSIEAVPTIIAFEKGKIISRRDSKMGIGLVKSGFGFYIERNKYCTVIEYNFSLHIPLFDWSCLTTNRIGKLIIQRL